MLFLGSGLDEIVVDEECDVVEVREWKLGGVVVGGGRYGGGGGYNGVHFYVTVLHIMVNFRFQILNKYEWAEGYK
ncbi:hypothetical protein ACSBR2_019894 [Camellia fascicularis]